MIKQFGLDDMFAYIAGMPVVGKRAIAFAVYSNIDISAVPFIKWTDEMDHPLPHKAASVLMLMDQIEGIDYVFWDNGPIFWIEDEFKRVSMGIKWTDFAKMFEKSVPIDFERDYGMIIREVFE